MNNLKKEHLLLLAGIILGFLITTTFTTAKKIYKDVQVHSQDFVNVQNIVTQFDNRLKALEKDKADEEAPIPHPISS